MKRFHILIIAVAALCAATACNRLEIPDQYPPVDEKDAPEMYIPYKSVYIDVPAGFKSVVYVGTNKIATCYRSGNVMIPKTSATKAGEGYEIVNIASEPSETVASENTLEMVVAYEDTKEGDHDYNDLVFQARLHIVNGVDGSNTTEVEITPIALGASKGLSLGVVLTGADHTVFVDKLIAQDCRTSLFDGDLGFLNTRVNLPRKHYAPRNITLNSSTSGGAVTGISWYIISVNERLYASTGFQACLDNSNAPQGLVLMNLRDDVYYKEEGGVNYYCGNDFWQYPEEGIGITKVYPDFETAFLGRGTFSVLATPVGDRYYNAIFADGDCELSENCLYTVYTNGGDQPTTVTGVQLWDGGPLWADRNVGASQPEGWGLFFEWGNVEGYPCEGETCEHTFTKTYDSSVGGMLTDSYVPGDVRYDPARYNLGGGWRVPTFQEVSDLFTHTDFEYIDDYQGTGVKGGKFTSKTDASKSIFIPMSGIVDYTTSKARDYFGYYWTNEICSFAPNHGYALGVSVDHGFGTAYGRNSALTVRAVCDVE